MDTAIKFNFFIHFWLVANIKMQKLYNTSKDNTIFEDSSTTSFFVYVNVVCVIKQPDRKLSSLLQIPKKFF
jgi:hypothetical protein